MEKTLIDQTKELWEPRYGRSLTDGEAEEIVRNMTDFFELLIEWEIKDRETLGEDGHGK